MASAGSRDAHPHAQPRPGRTPKEKMGSYLHELAARLVGYDTVSHKSNVDAMAYLGNHLEGHGFRVALQQTEVAGVAKANLVATAGPPEPDGLILSGHVDTVPYVDQPGWTHDPLGLEVDDTRVYGRGTSDMKVFLAQCVDAAGSLDVASLRRPVVFLFTADEEVGCLGAERLMPELAGLLNDVPRPGLAWIGEPTSYQVFHTHKGVVVFSVVVRGLGGHSSTPETGVNAIAVAGKVIATIGEYQAELRAAPSSEFAGLFPEAPYPTLNFGLVRGGTAGNMIAEQCSVQVSYRPLPQTDPLDCYHEIGRRLAALEPADFSGSAHRAHIELTAPLIVPPLFSPRATPLEATLFDVMDTRTSGGAPFATDGCQFAVGGITSLICGPGDLDQAHQPNENIRRAAFEDGTDRIVAVIRRMCVDAA